MATQNGVTCTVTIEGVSLSASAGISGAVSSIALRAGTARAQGTSGGQVDKVFAAALSIGETPVDYDLAGGSNVKDPASQADQTFTKLHGFTVTNTHATQNLVIGGDANSVPIFGAATHTIAIGPGGVFTWDFGGDGVTVTAGTGDILQIVGSGAATTGRLVLWGR
jgi:hypothetical protein